MTQFDDYDVVKAWLNNFKTDDEKAKELFEYIRQLKCHIGDLEKELDNLEYNVFCGNFYCEECYKKELLISELEEKLAYKTIRIKSVTSEEIVLENDLKPSETMFWIPGRKLGVTEL